ncbi:MAG: hypothetical protein N2Z63_04005 [Thiobacillaceae bacterium]|nr:hypothetical protein [Thiobacillaceae bacterium]
MPLPVSHTSSRSRPRSACADGHPTAVGVADGVGHQIAQDALDQHRIAIHPERGAAHTQLQSLVGGHGCEPPREPLQEALGREALRAYLHHARVEAGQVEQAVEQLLHGQSGFLQVMHDLPVVRIAQPVLERRHQQGQGVQGLTQIVAGGGEEARLRRHCGLGRLLLRAQFRRGLLDASLQALAPLLQGGSHAVDVVFELPQLAVGAGLDTHRQLTAGDALDGLAHRRQPTAQGLADPPRQPGHQRQDGGEQQGGIDEGACAQALHRGMVERDHQVGANGGERLTGQIGVEWFSQRGAYGVSEHSPAAKGKLIWPIAPGRGAKCGGLSAYHGPASIGALDRSSEHIRLCARRVQQALQRGVIAHDVVVFHRHGELARQGTAAREQRLLGRVQDTVEEIERQQGTADQGRGQRDEEQPQA